MRLVQVDIENFRGIKSISIPLDDTTVLIGENNSGKSSVLDAVQMCLSRSLTRKASQFSEYDYHLRSKDDQPASADPIRITLRFKERKENEWPDAVLQALSPALQVDADDGLNTLTLRVTSGFDANIGDFAMQWDFLDGAGNPMVGEAKNPRLVFLLQQFVPVFYLSALRDAAQEFRPRSQFWGPFVRSLRIEDEVRQQLEETLSELNQRVLDAHTSFADVKERLQQTTRLIPLGNDEPIHIEALPGKVFDLLSRTQVMLTCRSGAKLPLYRHGEGMQSLAVLFLFDAFLRARLEEEYDPNADPILALEEPEAHLHPSAIRALADSLQALKGQKIIATHSGDLLAGITLPGIRRLARKDGEITVYRLQPGTLSPEEINKVTYHIRSKRGNLLFARCWLFVEGETEYWLLPEFARQLNLDLDLNGVCCVEYRQFDIGPLIRLADDLGIPWHVLTDNDDQTKNDVKKVIEGLNGRDQGDHLTTLDEKDVEHCLWCCGYHSVYESAVSPGRRKNIAAPVGSAEYTSQVIEAAVKSASKPYLATAICAEAAKTGSPGIPPRIQAALKKAIDLAKKAT